MSEKVKITQEQADAIERWSDKEQLIIAKVVGLLEHGLDEPIYTLTTKELIQALYIGYEVEPEFKLNDWIVYENEYHKVVTQVIGTTESQIQVESHHEGFEDYPLISVNSPLIRHATPSEIAEEKERRTEEKLKKLLSELTQEEIKNLRNKLAWEYESSGRIADLAGDEDE